jgi:hypothetical protein
MSRLLGGGGDVHHHGLFAGLSAATGGVIIAGIGLWALWHRIAEQLGVAFLIAMWIMLMCGCAIAVAGAAWVWVMVIGHARRTLHDTAPAPVMAMTAQALPVADLPAIDTSAANSNARCAATKAVLALLSAVAATARLATLAKLNTAIPSAMVRKQISNHSQAPPARRAPSKASPNTGQEIPDARAARVLQSQAPCEMVPTTKLAP